MRRLYIIICLGLLQACSSTNPSNPDCFSSNCVLQETQRALAKTCVNQLFFYPRRLRRAIDSEYRYPLTNFDTYANWVRAGNRGPTPVEWCEHYAAEKVRITLPATLSRG